MKVKIVRSKTVEEADDIFENMEKVKEEIHQEINNRNNKYNYTFYIDRFPYNKLYNDHKNKKK